MHQNSQSYDVWFLRYWVRQTKLFVILGHFVHFYFSLLMILNIKILKTWKKCLEILSFYTHMCTINEDHMVYGSWNIRCDRQTFSTFWAIFLPFWPLDKLENKNFNIEKNTWRYYHFRDLHHKWQSFDVLFLRYGAWQTCFVILDHFLLFYPPMDPENQYFQRNIYKHKWQSYDVWFLKYGVQQTEFFVIFDHFKFFYPPNNPKN